MPRKVLQYVVQEAARKLNFFPVKSSVSDVYSTHAILLKKQLDFKTQCAAPILGATLAHDEPVQSNTMATRATESLYLTPTGDNGHLF